MVAQPEFVSRCNYDSDTKTVKVEGIFVKVHPKLADSQMDYIQYKMREIQRFIEFQFNEYRIGLSSVSQDNTSDDEELEESEVNG